jgi:hypothetical protein
MNEISIEGLEPSDVLAALYNAARPLGMGMLHYTPEKMSRVDDQEIIDRMRREWDGKEFASVDYVKGRPLKVTLDLTGKVLRNARLYDRNQGEGLCAEVIETLRKAA